MAPEPELHFAVAGPPDVDALLPLVRALHAFEHVRMNDTERRAALLPLLQPDSSVGRIWLIRSGSAAIGYLALTFGYSIEFRGRDGLIDEFFLAEPYRGRGLGGRVLEHIKAEAPALGLAALHLEVARDNQPARRLYGQYGFEARERSMLMSCRLWPGAG